MFKSLDSAEGRRAQSRRRFFRPVTVLLNGQPAFEARPFDISNEGVGITIDTCLKQGTSCALSFQLPLGGGAEFTVDVSAVVVYSMLSGKMGGFKTGMQFKNPTAKVADAILAYVTG
jgi:hypothetical protein